VHRGDPSRARTIFGGTSLARRRTTGTTGYIEISGNADDAPNVQVDGSSAAVEGRAGVDTGAQSADACVNGNEVL